MSTAYFHVTAVFARQQHWTDQNTTLPLPRISARCSHSGIYAGEPLEICDFKCLVVEHSGLRHVVNDSALYSIGAASKCIAYTLLARA